MEKIAAKARKFFLHIQNNGREGKDSLFTSLHWCRTFCNAVRSVGTGRPIFENFRSILCNKLEEFSEQEPLEIAEIFTFRKRLQKEGETAQEYLATLQKL